MKSESNNKLKQEKQIQYKVLLKLFYCFNSVLIIELIGIVRRG